MGQPAGVLRAVSAALIVAGALLIILFVPLRYWLALIGLVLLLAGIFIRMNL